VTLATHDCFWSYINSYISRHTFGFVDEIIISSVSYITRVFYDKCTIDIILNLFPFSCGKMFEKLFVDLCVYTLCW